MECLMSILASCLLSNSYVTVEAQYELNGTSKEGFWCSNHWCSGPMGMVRVGTKLDLARNTQLDVGFAHTSFIHDSKDHGEERVYLSLTWRPFR